MLCYPKVDTRHLLLPKYRMHGDLLPRTRTSCLVPFQMDISTLKILVHENIFLYHSTVCKFKNADKLVLPVTTSNSYNLKCNYSRSG